VSILRRADELLAAGDLQGAGALYQRVVGFDEPAITASALYGLGNVLYRLDRDDAAMATWERVLELPETPSTYLAWRQIAAMRVREGNLNGALAAYREADRRAPAADKPEIASRLGWLSKETGDTRGAARHFRRSRGANMPIVTYAIIALTVAVSFTAWTAVVFGRNGQPVDLGPIYPALWLDKPSVAAGELWRLVTVTLVHSPDQIFFFLHLGSNMYALYIVGPVVEAIYGGRRMALMYVLSAIAGSTASYVFFPVGQSVGASGAVFGMFGVVLVATRVHHPVLDRRGRAIAAQVGTLIFINLAFGFGVGQGFIDNAAHVGGLIGGAWLGLILLPPEAPTLARMWQRPGGASTRSWRVTPLRQVLGVAAFAVVVAVGLVVGAQTYQRGGAGFQVATVRLEHGVGAAPDADPSELQPHDRVDVVVDHENRLHVRRRIATAPLRSAAKRKENVKPIGGSGPQVNSKKEMARIA
jgi:membrane associated rhomboid family serine protease